MADVKVDKPLAPTCMESVNRIAKFPVIESTIQTATNIYGKVKDFNSMTQWTCSTAESAVNKAVEVGKPLAMPVVQGLEGPIKKVDGVLCSGLDYVETKVPAVKLPPGEIYTNTKEYVNTTVTPVVENAYSYVEPAVKSAYGRIEPAVQSARTVVEPLVEPVLEKAKEKIEQMLHPHHTHAEGVEECEDCKETVAQKQEHTEG